MQKKLLSNIALLMLVNLMVKPFWILGIERSVQNTVGYAQYGMYANMMSLSLILTMLLDFGINNYNSSTIAGDPSKLQTQFSSLMSFKILLSGTYLLLTLVLAFIYGYSGMPLLLILLLATSQVLAHFSTFIRSNISGLQLFRKDALLSAVDRFSMVILGLAMIGGFFTTSITHFIYIQVAGYVTALSASALVLRPYLKEFALRFNRALIADLLKKTYPYALLALIMLLYTRTDVLLIKKLLVNGDEENGIYASGGRLLEASNMMVGALTAILLPLYARMISAKEDITPVSRLVTSLILLPAIVFATCCFTYAGDIMQLLSPGTPDYTARVFRILILCFIPYTLMYLFGAMLTAKAEMRILNIVCGAALIVNIILNLWLIPLYGAMGAAVAALATQSVVGAGKLYFAARRIGLQHPVTWYLKPLGFLLISFGGFTLLYNFNTPIIIALLSMLLLMFAWIIVFKMIDGKKAWASLASLLKIG